MSYHPATVILIIAFALIPTAMWLEKNESRVWQERLVLPGFVQEPNRHTPRFPVAPYLPPLITESTAIGGRNTTFVISKTTRVSPAATLTIKEGTTIAFHEHARLIIEGSLTAIGTPADRIQFVSNEDHPENKTWAGIQFEEGATGVLQHIELEHGNPAVSCLPQSHVDITNSSITFGNVGLYTESAACELHSSTITGTLRGVIARNITPVLSNNSFNTSQSPLILK